MVVVDRDADELEAWRNHFRAENIGARYSGWLHFSYTTFGSLAVIGLAASRVHGMRPLEWALLPVFFLVTNLGEYFGHRGPLHHRTAGLGLVFERHTLQHHRFFTEGAMGCASARDFKIVLFPPVMLLFFVGALAAPIGLLLYVAISANAGYLFAVVAVGYFLLYEWLHFAYHQPDGAAIGRLPFMAALRRHHQTHHDPARMTRWNFNITFPVGDVLFRTRHPGSS
jgi:hypothetical protein